MISIILPTYNRSAIINRTIDCVLNQSYTNFELIIWDNQSFDNTKKIVKNFLSAPTFTCDLPEKIDS